MNEVHREMRAALERGWSVIPLHPRSKRPLLPSWREFQQRPAGARTVETWLRRWPDCNYGICTGVVSRCMALDQDGAAGAKSLAGRELPRPPTVETHSGLHRYYDHPGWRVRTRLTSLTPLTPITSLTHRTAPPRLPPRRMSPLSPHPTRPPGCAPCSKCRTSGGRRVTDDGTHHGGTEARRT